MMRRLGLGKNNHLTYASLALNPRLMSHMKHRRRKQKCNRGTTLERSVEKILGLEGSAYPSSLIRIFAVHSVVSGCASISESSLGAHAIL